MGSDGMSAGRCDVCGDSLSPGGLADILDHLRVIHPEVYGDGPERYADGGLVIHVDPDSMTVETVLNMEP